MKSAHVNLFCQVSLHICNVRKCFDIVFYNLFINMPAIIHRVSKNKTLDISS